MTNASFDIKRPVEDKLVQEQDIHTKMLVDALFNNPPVPYADFLSAIVAQRLAAANAAQGGQLATAELHAATLKVETIVRKLQGFVNSVANGDKELVLRSAFTPSKAREPIGSMPKVEILWIKIGNVSGGVKVRVKAIKGKKFLEVQVRPVATTPFATVLSPSNSIFALSGLVPLSEYVVRIRAHGARSTGNWSDEQTFKVL